MAQTDADPAVSVDSGFAFEIRSDGPKVVIHDKVPYPVPEPPQASCHMEHCLASQLYIVRTW